jgi:hypothetical protein
MHLMMMAKKQPSQGHWRPRTSQGWSQKRKETKEKKEKKEKTKREQ